MSGGKNASYKMISQKKNFNLKFQHCCQDMDRVLVEKRLYIRYLSKYREYYMEMRDAPAVTYLICYCPWCSKKLPKSVRRKWFNILEKEYNLEDPWNEKQSKLIPEEFKTDEWWKKRGY
jgi:hypothetical protein